MVQYACDRHHASNLVFPAGAALGHAQACMQVCMQQAPRLKPCLSCRCCSGTCASLQLPSAQSCPTAHQLCTCLRPRKLRSAWQSPQVCGCACFKCKQAGSAGACLLVFYCRCQRTTTSWPTVHCKYMCAAPGSTLLKLTWALVWPAVKCMAMAADGVLPHISPPISLSALKLFKLVLGATSLPYFPHLNQAWVLPPCLICLT